MSGLHLGPAMCPKNYVAVHVHSIQLFKKGCPTKLKHTPQCRLTVIVYQYLIQVHSVSARRKGKHEYSVNVFVLFLSIMLKHLAAFLFLYPLPLPFIRLLRWLIHVHFCGTTFLITAVHCQCMFTCQPVNPRALSIQSKILEVGANDVGISWKVSPKKITNL